MILNKKNKPYGNEDRVKRLEWLIVNKNKYYIDNYPWGLEGSDLKNKELTIIKAMRGAKLFSNSTNDRDINLGNLIVDALYALRYNKYISDEEYYGKQV